jgi:hypothetical protein
MNNFFSHKGKVFTTFGGELFDAPKELPLMERPLQVAWKGAKIPLGLWKQISAFCQYTFDKYNSEGLVRLYYSRKESRWFAYAHPQQMVAGLSIKDTISETFKPFTPDAVLAGTVHHHCGIAAFQSGVDAADEKDVVGLHITLGEIDKPKWGWHHRFSTRASFITEVDLLSFFELNPELAGIEQYIQYIDPAKLEERIVAELTKGRVEDPLALIPEEWVKNLIEPAARTYPVRQIVGDDDYWGERWHSNYRYDRFGTQNGTVAYGGAYGGAYGDVYGATDKFPAKQESLLVKPDGRPIDYSTRKQGGSSKKKDKEEPDGIMTLAQFKLIRAIIAKTIPKDIYEDPAYKLITSGRLDVEEVSELLTAQDFEADFETGEGFKEWFAYLRYEICTKLTVFDYVLDKETSAWAALSDAYQVYFWLYDIYDMAANGADIAIPQHWGVPLATPGKVNVDYVLESVRNYLIDVVE